VICYLDDRNLYRLRLLANSFSGLELHPRVSDC
jgi:hypothetical protein